MLKKDSKEVYIFLDTALRTEFRFRILSWINNHYNQHKEHIHKDLDTEKITMEFSKEPMLYIQYTNRELIKLYGTHFGN